MPNWYKDDPLKQPEETERDRERKNGSPEWNLKICKHNKSICHFKFRRDSDCFCSDHKTVVVYFREIKRKFEYWLTEII